MIFRKWFTGLGKTNLVITCHVNLIKKETEHSEVDWIVMQHVLLRKKSMCLTAFLLPSF